MEAEMFGAFRDFGLAGAMIVVLVIQVRYLQSKLVNIIEANTKALSDLHAIIERCQLMHSREG